MPLMTKYGNFFQRVDYKPYSVSALTPALSYTVDTTPEPPPANAIKRAKPAVKDLVWNGTSYAKTYHSMRSNQLCYGDIAGTYHIWQTASAFIGTPYVRYPSSPYDPMNPLLGKINGDLANIANMLGEYKQTSKMFSDAGSRFTRSVRYARRAARMAKRGNFDGAYGAVRSALQSLGAAAEGAAKAAFPPNRTGRPSLSNAWLQWHFGVDTLMKDLYNVCKELKAEVDDTSPYTVKKYTKSSNRTIDGSITPYNGATDGNKWITEYSSFKRTLVAYVEIDNLELKLASDHGLTNPASLVWELTTLSFVVDWFIGIGEWITALGVPATLKRSICYETQRKRSLTYVNFMNGWFRPAGYKLISGYCTVISVHRSTTRTIRPLTAARPRWKASASESRVATALALLRQMKK